MAYQDKLVRLGEGAIMAKFVTGGELDLNVSLTGSTGTNGTSTGSCVNAYVINKDITFVNAATSSTAGNAAILPNLGSAFITVFNNTASSIYVFAPVGGQINNYAATGMTTNAGNSFAGCFQIATNKSSTFMSADGAVWFAQHAG